ncbi:MAG: hypothetical protein AAFY60_05000, partial [Myxococcota bacterium]
RCALTRVCFGTGATLAPDRFAAPRLSRCVTGVAAYKGRWHHAITIERGSDLPETRRFRPNRFPHAGT